MQRFLEKSEAGITLNPRAISRVKKELQRANTEFPPDQIQIEPDEGRLDRFSIKLFFPEDCPIGKSLAERKKAGLSDWVELKYILKEGYPMSGIVMYIVSPTFIAGGSGFRHSDGVGFGTWSIFHGAICWEPLFKWNPILNMSSILRQFHALVTETNCQVSKKGEGLIFTS